MATRISSGKVECLNPNTGGKINIDLSTYELFSKAIYHTLKAKGPVSFTEMVEGIRDCFKKQGTVFKGSISWYAVTVKNDLESRKVIHTYMEKGKKLHQLSK